MGTEEKLILAALNQFKLHGFNGATTKAIAAEAGVAEVTLFRYFGDKKTLFMRTAEYVGEQFGLINIPDSISGDLRRDVTRMCEGLLRHFITQNELIRMLIFEVKKYENTRTLLTNIRRRAMENIRRTVGRYHDSGAGECTTDCAEWLLSSMIGSSLCFDLFHDTEDPDAFIRVHAGMIANAFTEKLTTGK